MNLTDSARSHLVKQGLYRALVAGKARVHELAKELGVTSKDVLEKLNELGEFVKSASSTVEPKVARKLRDAFLNPRPAVKPLRAVQEPAVPVLEGTAGVEQVLVSIVQDFGEVWNELRRLRAVLNDLVLDRRAATLLYTVAEERIVYEIHASLPSFDDRSLNRFTQTLIHRRVIDPRWAAWAVTTWATALRSVPAPATKSRQTPVAGTPRRTQVPPSIDPAALARNPGTVVVVSRSSAKLVIVPPNSVAPTTVALAVQPGLVAIAPHGTPNAGAVFIAGSTEGSTSTLLPNSLDVVSEAVGGSARIPKLLMIAPAGAANAGYAYIAAQEALVVLTPDGRRDIAFAHGNEIDAACIGADGTIYLLRDGVIERYTTIRRDSSVVHLPLPTLHFEAPAVCMALSPSGTPGYLLVSHDAPGGISLVDLGRSGAIEFCRADGWLARRLIVGPAPESTREATVIGAHGSSFARLNLRDLVKSIAKSERRTAVAVTERFSLFEPSAHLDVIGMSFTQNTMGALAWGTVRGQAATQLAILSRPRNSANGAHSASDPNSVWVVDLESSNRAPAMPVLGAVGDKFVVTMPHTDQLGEIDFEKRHLRTVELGVLPSAMSVMPPLPGERDRSSFVSEGGPGTLASDEALAALRAKLAGR